MELEKNILRSFMLTDINTKINGINSEIKSFIALKLSNKLNPAKIYVQNPSIWIKCVYLRYISLFMNLPQIYLTGFNSFCMIVATERLQCQIANNHVTTNNCIYTYNNTSFVFIFAKNCNRVNLKLHISRIFYNCKRLEIVFFIFFLFLKISNHLIKIISFYNCRQIRKAALSKITYTIIRRKKRMKKSRCKK